MSKLYTENEVISLMEQLGTFYKYDPKTKLWRMDTLMAPGMLHQTSEQLLKRLKPE